MTRVRPRRSHQKKLKSANKKTTMTSKMTNMMRRTRMKMSMIVKM